MSIQHQVIIPQHPLESKIAAPMREYTSANQDTMATEPNNNITPVNGAVTPPAINGETVNQTLTIRMIMQGKVSSDACCDSMCTFIRVCIQL